MLTFLADFWPWLVGLLHLVIVSATTVHIVLWKRDSRAAIGWVGLVWLSPFVGAAFYYAFGVNRIRRKAARLRERETLSFDEEPPLTAEDAGYRDKLLARYPNLLGLGTVGHHLTSRPVLPGNHIEPLCNGDEAYPAMLAAIGQAKQSIALLSYIFDSDRIGDQFLDALIAAKNRGVEIRVLVDDVGSRYSKPNMLSRLHAAGINATAFLPSRTPRLFKFANLRNHRKILIVDGSVGFTGGTNIRAAHCLELKTKHPVQCVHFKIDGPVVRQIQEAFAIDWAFTTGEYLSGRLWFPDIPHDGPVWARGIPNGPDEDFEKMSDVILAALSVATRSVRVVTPYFLPDNAMIRAFNVAAMRGVDVRICMPSKNNIPPVNWASMSQMWQLLEKGCRVYLSATPFDHTKLFVVDGSWSLIGSTNWDDRSLRLNFEFNVECYSDTFAETLNAIIDRKLSTARELTLEEVDSRSYPIRFRDGLARLMTPYL